MVTKTSIRSAGGSRDGVVLDSPSNRWVMSPRLVSTFFLLTALGHKRGNLTAGRAPHERCIGLRTRRDAGRQTPRAGRRGAGVRRQLAEPARTARAGRRGGGAARR